jgi:hypothetical protein
MKYYREWVPKLKNRCGRMVDLDTLKNIMEVRYDSGYASLYAFDEQTSQQIKGLGNSRNWDDFTAYSDHLIVDIDDQVPEQAGARTDALSEKLKGMGTAHEVYNSGGKGYHFVIPHQWIGSVDLPHSHRKYAEDVLGIVSDTSIYHTNGLISLPGRVHPTTKAKKRLVFKCPGDEIDLQIVKKPELTFNFSDLGVSDMGVALTNLQMLATCPPTPGKRHTRLWGVATDLARTGLDIETVTKLLQGVNDSWPDKKSPGEVETAVQQAYRRLSLLPL